MLTYRRRIGNTVNNGVAWKTPSCICSCQWCIKLEVFCATVGCCGNGWSWRGPQYDGKCSFYLNCYFFHTSPTNRDLREKAVYFPPRLLTPFRMETSWSLAWDHFCRDIDDPCGVIADSCGIVMIPEAIGSSSVPDADHWATH